MYSDIWVCFLYQWYQSSTLWTSNDRYDTTWYIKMFMSTRYSKRTPQGNPSSQTIFSANDTLAKLCEYLPCEFTCSKLITCKYKHFQSTKIKFEQKTRLNNVIWRAWHIQYKQKRKACFLQFAAPFSDESTHSTSQAVILDGKYWKRRLDKVGIAFIVAWNNVRFSSLLNKFWKRWWWIIILQAPHGFRRCRTLPIQWTTSRIYFRDFTISLAIAKVYTRKNIFSVPLQKVNTREIVLLWSLAKYWLKTQKNDQN